MTTVGGHGNNQPPNKRSSSGADGDYQLVQHEVLFSGAQQQYEVSQINITNLIFIKVDDRRDRRRRRMYNLSE